MPTKPVHEKNFLARMVAGIGEAIVPLVREAVVDIRHKVVEEPWFGRETTKDFYRTFYDQQPQRAHGESPYVAEGLPPTFDEYIAQREGRNPAEDRAPEIEKTREPEDMDR
jgi:hypothetical protein